MLQVNHAQNISDLSRESFGGSTGLVFARLAS